MVYGPSRVPGGRSMGSGAGGGRRFYRERTAASLGDDGVLHGPQRGGGAGRDADLVVDVVGGVVGGRGGGACRVADLVVEVLGVVIGGLLRDEEPIGNRLRRQSPRREAQHVYFAM